MRLRETKNALQLPVFFFLWLPALSGIAGNSEQKNILHTTEQLIQYTVLGIHFRSLKYTTVIGIRTKLSNFLLSKRCKAITVSWCKQPNSNIFQACLYLFKSITILLTNDSTNMCCEIRKIRLILWMVYTRVGGSWKVG